MRKYAYLLLFLLLVGCSEKPQTRVDLMIFKRDQIKEIDRISYDNDVYIDSCIFVPLETSDQGLIGEVTQLETFDGKYYIFDKQTNKLKVFDRTGRFLHDIGNLGQGAGEYASINVFVVNRKERKICLFDPAKNAVHEYTLEGKFLQTIVHNQLEYSYFIKAAYAGDLIYCFSSINWGNNMAYSAISSTDYSLKESFCPYPVKPDQQMAFVAMDYPFSLVDGRFHSVSLFSDTVYTYENGKEIPYLLIETGKPNIPPAYLKDQHLENDPVKAYFQIWQDDKYSSGLTELGETGRFVITGSKLGESDGPGGIVSKRTFYILDKKNKEGFYVKSSDTPDLGLPTLVEGNKLIKVWKQQNIEAYKNQIGEGSITCPESIKSLLSGYDPEFHNPILVVYYMKD